MTKRNAGVDASVADSVLIDTLSPRGIVTATLAGFARGGVPLLDIPGDSPRAHVAARSCVMLKGTDVGKQVVIVPDLDRPDSPIVIGVIQPPTTNPAVEITADGQSVLVRAEESMILKCGDASITLTRDGKVVIRGNHVVTHASGVNRIRGGSVQLN